jgi:hypothetical protein
MLAHILIAIRYSSSTAMVRTPDSTRINRLAYAGQKDEGDRNR